MTDVPDRVRGALVRAAAARRRPDQHDHLWAMVELAAMARAGQPVPSQRTVCIGALVRDQRTRWRRVERVSELSVTASLPPPERPARLPWHQVTGFCDPLPPPGTVIHRRSPLLF